MSFGEWCGVVAASILGIIGLGAAGLFVFIMVLRWPIALVLAVYFIAKST